MNEEEIIKYIENVINTIKESDMLFDEPANISCGGRMAGALKGILNLYNQAKQQNLKLRLQELPRLQGEIDAYKEFLHQEKEKNKKLEERVEEVEKWYEKLDIDFDMARKDNEKLQLLNLDNEKVIDMMAEDISSGDLFTWDGSSELVKEYYFKKARGEEDVKD